MNFSLSAFYSVRCYTRQLLVILFLLMVPLLPLTHADTDVQMNNKQGREMTPLMPELSCSKKARRINKLDNKTKRRKFIKQCRAEREIKMKAQLKIIEQEREKKKHEDERFLDTLEKVTDLEPDKKP
ncbi:MAG: hypothetical protein ACC707_09900 [Thiohalomonadales bacterium]